MKIFGILVLFFSILYSCNRLDNLPMHDKFGHRIFYSEDDYMKNGDETGKHTEIFIDTFCTNQKERAIKDIKNNKLKYYTSWAPHKNELSKAFKKYNIEYAGFVYSTCLISPFKDHCYETEMIEEVEKRYGQKFVDSIWNSTLKEHLEKFPNETFNENGKIIKLKDCYQGLLR